MTQRPHNLGLAFADIARQHAGRIALRLEGEPAMRYGELDAQSNRLANHLASQGVGLRDVVALVHDKSASGYVAMLACLKLGAVVVNLDDTNPAERLGRILDTAQPRRLLSATEPPADARNAAAQRGIAIEQLEGDGASAWMQACSDAPAAMPAVTGTDPAYLMYTSGSTGTPKGAVIAHGAVLRFAEWIADRFDVTPNDVFSGLNPAYFDNSVFDFYGALFNGASLAPVKRATARDAQAMLRRLDEAGCTLWFSVPSMLIFVNTMKALSAHSLPALRAFVFGGEGFPKPELRKLFERHGHRAAFVNVYGPTECTCICSAHTVTLDDLNDATGLAPLGRLNPDFSGLVLDEQLQPVPEGEAGELWLGGPNVGLGYCNDPERTAASFAQHPGHQRYPERLYRTGDLVRLNAQGLYEFVGRRDHQIKHMGYRIELEEIEAALCALPGVAQAGVIYRRVREQFGQIEAFVAAHDETCEIDEAGLRDALRAVLPDYMVPRRVVVMPALPKNANGKVDRPALMHL